MSDDLVERLRDAHAGSQQRIVGSNIFADAADTIEAKDAEIERLQRERDDALEQVERARSRAEQAERERDDLREWKQNQQAHWLSEIERRNRDLERAERALAEAVVIIKFGLDVVSEERGWGTYQRMKAARFTPTRLCSVSQPEPSSMSTRNDPHKSICHCSWYR